MWLVAFYEEYFGYDLINMPEGLKLYETKKEAKREAKRLNKKIAKQLHTTVENLGSEYYDYIYIEKGKKLK